jgi:hypothetical protein
VPTTADALEIGRLEATNALQDDLDVLLRHRLLPWPGGFEGLVAVSELLQPSDLAIAHVFDARDAADGGHQCVQPGSRIAIRWWSPLGPPFLSARRATAFDRREREREVGDARL